MAIITTSTYSYDDRLNAYRCIGLTLDGTTDNRSILQATLDAAAATGGVVYLPSGNIRVRLNSTPVTPDANGDIASLAYGISIGANTRVVGHPNTVLVFNETISSGHQACVYIAADNVWVQGIQFNNSISTSGTANNQHGIVAFGCDDVVIRDCRIYNTAGVGCYLHGDSDSVSLRINRARVERCSFRTSRGVGIKCTYAQQFFFLDNHFLTGQSTAVDSPAFSLKQIDQGVISRATLNAWGPICSLDGSAATVSLNIGDIVQKFPATLHSRTGIYTTDATPSVQGLIVGRVLVDGSAASAGTNTFVYLRGVNTASISQINIYGGGGALTTYDIIGTSISVSGCQDSIGTASSTTATFGGTGGSKIQVGGCSFGGSATFGLGCTSISGNSFVGGVTLSSITYGAFVGNHAAPASGAALAATSCVDFLISGNDFLTNLNSGNSVTLTSCTRVHYAANRCHNIGSVTALVSDVSGNTNCAIHTSFGSSTGGVATHSAFSSNLNNYDL